MTGLGIDPFADPRAVHRAPRSRPPPDSDGMRRMRDDGLDKVRQGLTSVAEVLRVLDA